MFQSWPIYSTDKTYTMIIKLIILYFLLLHLSPTTPSKCSEVEEYNHKKAAQLCYNKILTNLDVETSCDGFDFENSDCDRGLEKCFEEEFIREMRDFYLEKAINFQQWIFLAKRLLDNSQANSVFYFFSPFLVQFCSGHQLQWFHIFYEECMHVKTVTRKWPVGQTEFMECPSVVEYISNGRKQMFGPVMSCSGSLNLVYNFCVQKHMNILPAKKNSSWKDACKNLEQVNNLWMNRY
jgi:hypothetical protein